MPIGVMGQGIPEIPIIVSTDADSYLEGETVIISGMVGTIYDSSAVSLLVKSPSGNIVTIAQIEIKHNKFEHQFTTGPKMTENGAYTVEVQYIYPTIKDVTTFEYTMLDRTQFLPSEDEGPSFLFVEDQQEPIEYMITGGIVKSAIPSPPNTLILYITPTDPGFLEITIPRHIFDSATPDGDVRPVIGYVDQQITEVLTKDFTDTHRTYVINFNEDSAVIELRGTHVVPEFPAAIAVISIAFIALMLLPQTRSLFARGMSNTQLLTLESGKGARGA